ncbi:adenosylmethionine decarboxylase [cyanobiont of Ornithocercus magnificus]|nr:adenosylmethionine decarboxylase [cyanobiont of Ornithocercus magnificus]
MEQILSCLHPNPGWQQHNNLSNARVGGEMQASPSDMVGKHCILDLYDCDARKLDDEAFLKTTIAAAARSAGATLISLIAHRFEPQGVTGLALLAESHISIHTWPESCYAAVDVFTCGDHTVPEEACEVLRQELVAGSHTIRSFLRKTPITVVNARRKPVTRLI